MDQSRPLPDHHIPVIDKMMKIIEHVEAAGMGGVAIAQIVQGTRVPRSTAYRILNTLCAHNLLGRSRAGVYTLGVRFRQLGDKVSTLLSDEEVLAVVEPVLAALAEQTQQTCKFSVLDDGHAVVRAVVVGASPYAPASRLGAAFALHAGAASKLLLAHADPQLRHQILAADRPRYTQQTLSDASDLRRELDRIVEEGFSTDRGEWTGSVHAVAAPVFSYGKRMVGAISILYFAQAEDAVPADLSNNVRAAARRASSNLGWRA